MTLKKKLSVAGVIVLSGFGLDRGLEALGAGLSGPDPIERTVSGLPQSVAAMYDGMYGGSLSVVLDANGVLVLGSVSFNTHTYKIRDAEALINAEINDRDNEEIMLRGYDSEGKFIVNGISVGGYNIEFSR